MTLLLLLLLDQLYPCLRLPLLQEEVAAAAKVQLQRQRPKPGLLYIEQPKMLPYHPLLHQEMPVHHWITLCDVLPAFFSPHHPLQDVAG